MPKATTRATLLVLLVAGMATSALAEGGNWVNDAGSGADAGNARALATPIAVGSTYTATYSSNDIDWFAATADGSAPSCIAASAHTTTRAFFALGIERSEGANTTAPMRVSPNMNGPPSVFGIAGMSPLTATLRVRDDPLGQYANAFYDFRLDRVGIPATGDAGTDLDAGDSPTSAFAATAGCTGGHLSALSIDMRDVFAIQVPEGQVVTYSLAANAPGIELSLLDAVGDAIGPVIASGGFATASPLSSGTYYMSAQRGASVGDIGYVIGTVIGPEPTGCKPYCLD